MTLNRKEREELTRKTVRFTAKDEILTGIIEEVRVDGHVFIKTSKGLYGKDISEVEEVVTGAADKIDLAIEFADMRNILAIILNSSYPGSGLTGDDIKETVSRGHEKINKIEDEVKKRLEGVQ